MTGYLKFLAMIEAIAYVIYLLLFFFGQFNLPYALKYLELIILLIVTFSFITTEVILGSIIEVREAVFGVSKENYNLNVEGERKPSGTANILEKGGSLIEQNSLTKKWICPCGFHNPTSSNECLSCSKRRSIMNR